MTGSSNPSSPPANPGSPAKSPPPANSPSAAASPVQSPASHADVSSLIDETAALVADEVPLPRTSCPSHTNEG
ncbi:hypothetical protein IMZ48_43800 [Candidatus Bathyarchaeota archaeon]|nr:hypothetical protein [Candidatus Bathyarchaeota archaeon]